MGPSFLHADSKDSDQTGPMPRLVRVFTGHTLTLLVLSRDGSNVLIYTATAMAITDQNISVHGNIKLGSAVIDWKYPPWRHSNYNLSGIKVLLTYMGLTKLTNPYALSGKYSARGTIFSELK